MNELLLSLQNNSNLKNNKENYLQYYTQLIREILIKNNIVMNNNLINFNNLI